jgi:DNA-binding PadR family transcriptional regulator
MSTTRLVVLGAVRAFQPVHGYYVRRELMTWQVGEWANINPGSIYNALRVLTRQGFLEEVDTGSSDARPARTTYQLTPDGESAFMTLLRHVLWTVETFDPQPIMATLSFMGALNRQEVIDAFEHRIGEIDARLLAGADAKDEGPEKGREPGPGQGPGQVTARGAGTVFADAMVELTSARMLAEQEWARVLVKRLRNGEYTFADEPHT